MGQTSTIPSKRSLSIRTSSKSIVPLYEACRDGDVEQVRKLLPNYSSTDLNRQESSYNGNTCLHIAAANGHDNIVKILLQHGCYRSRLLNNQNQSAYDIAVLNKESIRLLFCRHHENSSSSDVSLRFCEQNASECFDIVKVNDIEDQNDKLMKSERPSVIKTYKTDEEKKHEIEYSATSKTMCQSRLARFCVNHLHSDEPLNHQTIIKRLTDTFEKTPSNYSDDYIKVDELIEQYEKKSHSIEQLLHLYTLETEFYRTLQQDCLPLALPLFIDLPKLKERFFKGRVYRGVRMSYQQLLTYQRAMEISGTVLQTRSFSSTSKDRLIAEGFAYEKISTSDKNLQVLFIFDFPNICDQAIDLSRISTDIPCLSEYEDEEEVLILPWTLFEVTRIRKANDEEDFYTIYLNNIIIPDKNLLSTFKWSWVELKNQFIKEKKFKFDCAFQKYNTSLTTPK